MKTFKDLQKGDIVYARRRGLNYDKYDVRKLTVVEVYKENHTAGEYVAEYDVDLGYTGGKIIDYDYEVGYIVFVHWINDKEEKDYFLLPIRKSSFLSWRTTNVTINGNEYELSTDEGEFLEKFKKHIQDMESDAHYLTKKIEDAQEEYDRITKKI